MILPEHSLSSWTFLPTFASNLILYSFVSIWCGRWLEKVWNNSRIFLFCVPGESISGHLEWESAALCWRTSPHTVCKGPKRPLILFIPVSTIWWAWKSHPVQKLDTLVSCCCPGICESVLYCQEHNHRLISPPFSNSRLCRPRVAQTEMLWLPFRAACSSSNEDKKLKCVYFCAE